MTDHMVDDGTVELVGSNAVIRLTREYPNSVDDVWDALTNPDRLAQWWLPFDADITIELVEGGDYILRGKGEGMPTLSWKVLRAESPYLFEHTHADPGAIITWRLREKEGGCELEFTQTLPDRTAAIENNFIVGAHTSLDRLGALLRGTPIAWDWEAMGAHQIRYANVGLATLPEE
jgi:uncharacterized protein YndB with AHSA1/START domain